MFTETIDAGTTAGPIKFKLSDADIAQQMNVSVDEVAKMRKFTDLGKEASEQALKRANMIKTLRGGGSKALGIAGAALDLYMAESESHELKEKKGITMGQARAQAYTKAGVGTGIGVLSAVGAGAAYGAMGGAPTGPGAIITGLLGGVAGGVLYYWGGGADLVEGAVESMQDLDANPTAARKAAIRAKEQRANQATKEALEKARNNQERAVGDQASLDAGKRNLIINLNGNKIHEQDITNLFDPSGTKRIPTDVGYDVGVMPA